MDLSSPCRSNYSNKGADLPVSGALAFEMPIDPFAVGFPTLGIHDFTTKEGREKRRKLSRGFWQR